MLKGEKESEVNFRDAVVYLTLSFLKNSSQ